MLLTLMTAYFLTGCVVEFFAFHPNDSHILPAEALPPDTEEVFLETEDGVRIQALFLRAPASHTVTIYFHGNAGNVYHRLRDLQHLRGIGTNVLAVSYRGYAKSGGSPSEDGIYGDGRAAYEYAVTGLEFPPSRIFLFGRSLGTTVAVDLAQRKDLAGVILVSPLSNARDMAGAMGLGFGADLAGDAFRNDWKVRSVIAPLLVIHGTQDRVIPIELGRKVFDAAPGWKVFQVIQDAGHNDLSDRFTRRYWESVRAFIERSTLD